LGEAKRASSAAALWGRPHWGQNLASDDTRLSAGGTDLPHRSGNTARRTSPQQGFSWPHFGHFIAALGRKRGELDAQSVTARIGGNKPYVAPPDCPERHETLRPLVRVATEERSRRDFSRSKQMYGRFSGEARKAYLAGHRSRSVGDQNFRGKPFLAPGRLACGILRYQRFDVGGVPEARGPAAARQILRALSTWSSAWLWISRGETCSRGCCALAAGSLRSGRICAAFASGGPRRLQHHR